MIKMFEIHNGDNGSVINFANNEANYDLIEVTGVNGYEKNINTTQRSGGDGSTFNSERTPEREINVVVKPKGDIETKRQAVAKLIACGANGVVILIQTDNRRVNISGHGKIINSDAFTENELISMSFICPSPYFKAWNYDDTDIAKGTSTTTVANNGDIPIGFRATFNLTSISNSPTKISIEKQDSRGNHKIIINYPDGFQTGDTISIINDSDKKEVTLSRSGVAYTLVGYIDWQNTEWFDLKTGNSYIRYAIGGVYAYTGTATCTLTKQDLYSSI